MRCPVRGNTIFSHSYIIDRMTYYHSQIRHSVVSCITHWGRMMHIWVSKVTTIGSDNGLSPDRSQTIIWTNTGILLIGPLGTNLNESANWRQFCLGLKVVSLVPRQSRDCSNVIDTTFDNLVKHAMYIHYELILWPNHNKAKQNMSIFDSKRITLSASLISQALLRGWHTLIV